jgi:glutathione-independent formaldehyde dehydrogenase
VAVLLCFSPPPPYRNKGQFIGQGQCPVMAHNVDLLKAILHDRLDVSQLLNVKVIPLAAAEQAYKDFDAGEAAKYIIDPHGMLA